MYRKYRDATHIARVMNQISQPCLEASPIWIPLVRAGIGRLIAGQLIINLVLLVNILWIGTDPIDLCRCFINFRSCPSLPPLPIVFFRPLNYMLL
jgi:hypothetical protein